MTSGVGKDKEKGRHPRKEASRTGATPRDAGLEAAMSELHSKELERMSLQYMDRIRAGEYARLELERKLELEKQEQLELISAGQQQVDALVDRLDHATRMLAEAERKNAAALREEFQRHQEVEARLQQKLMHAGAEIASSSGMARQFQRQLEQILGERDAAAAQLREMERQLEERRTLLAERDR